MVLTRRKHDRPAIRCPSGLVGITLLKRELPRFSLRPQAFRKLKDEEIADVLLENPGEHQSTAVSGNTWARITQGVPGWRGQLSLLTGLEGQHEQGRGFAGRGPVHNSEPLS